MFILVVCFAFLLLERFIVRAPIISLTNIFVVSFALGYGLRPMLIVYLDEFYNGLQLSAFHDEAIFALSYSLLILLGVFGFRFIFLLFSYQQSSQNFFKFYDSRRSIFQIESLTIKSFLMISAFTYLIFYFSFFHNSTYQQYVEKVQSQEVPHLFRAIIFLYLVPAIFYISPFANTKTATKILLFLFGCLLFSSFYSRQLVIIYVLTVCFTYSAAKIALEGNPRLTVARSFNIVILVLGILLIFPIMLTLRNAFATGNFSGVDSLESLFLGVDMLYLFRSGQLSFFDFFVTSLQYNDSNLTLKSIEKFIKFITFGGVFDDAVNFNRQLSTIFLNGRPPSAGFGFIGELYYNTSKSFLATVLGTIFFMVSIGGLLHYSSTSIKNPSDLICKGIIFFSFFMVVRSGIEPGIENFLSIYLPFLISKIGFSVIKKLLDG